MAPQRTRRPASLPSPDPRPGRVAGAVIAAAAAVALLWFIYQIMTALLLFFFALVVSIALGSVVRGLRRRGLSRRIATTVTLVGFFGLIALLIYAIVPPLAEQMASLAARLPDILSSIGDRVAAQLTEYPDLQQWVHADNKVAEQLLPTAARMLAGMGGVSLSVLGALTLFVIFMSAVIYLVADPLPLMRGYAYALPRRYRVPGLRAYARASRAVLGWVRGSVVIGPIEAVLSGIFLSFMHVPGALVWAALAFFAEFVPRIGGYIMAIPPVVVALTVGPSTALWVALFYLIMTELLGTFLGPVVRGSRMRIHPAVLVFFTLSFALAFGLLGAVIAAPATAFISAYYDEFYLKPERA